MRYRPDLDGLRAVSVLAVLCTHAGINLVGGGWMGVDVFFVLSGYLITELLLAEWDSTNRISLGRFYARRALRLYPALLLMILLGAAFYRTLGDPPTPLGYLRTAAIAGFYLQDIVTGFFNVGLAGGFGHTWSLAVEEQFYLLWPPLLVVLLRSGRSALPWAAALSLASWALLVQGSMHDSRFRIPLVYELPWSRFSELLLGCCVALWLRNRRPSAWIGRNVVGWSLALVGIALVLAAGRLYRYPNFAWQSPAIGLVTAAMLVHLLNPGSQVRRVLGLRPFAWAGRRSYGFYLFHVPIIEVLGPHLHVGKSMRLLVYIGVSFTFAALSYRFVESPFLRRKTTLQPVGQAGAAARSKTSASTLR